MIVLFKKKENKKIVKDVAYPSHVISLNESSFDEFILKYPLSIVDFWAPWCGPCKTMLPRLRRLERLYQSRVAFARLNTQEYQEIAKKFNILSIPHFGFFSYGKKIGSLIGVKSVGDMKESIENYLLKI